MKDLKNSKNLQLSMISQSNSSEADKKSCSENFEGKNNISKIKSQIMKSVDKATKILDKNKSHFLISKGLLK